MLLSKVAELSNAVVAEVEQAVVGKGPVLRQIMATILAGGHILLEDYPGLAKTLTANSFAIALGLDFRRIQFTPDLMPATSLAATSTTATGGILSCAKGRSSPILSWPTRSTGPRPRPNPPCWKRCRSIR